MFLPKHNRHKEESDYIIEEMRNEADQAVAGLAIQDCKKDRINKNPAKVPRNDPHAACGIMRCGKKNSPGNSCWPERKELRALPHKECAIFDLFTENRSGLIKQQQRELINSGHIYPPQYMVYVGTAKH